LDSDLDELRSILGRDEPATDPDPDAQSTAPEPHDGAPPDDEQDSDSPELSAEERIAALMAAEMEASGAAEDEEEPEADGDDEPAEAEDDGSDEDLDALLEEGRQARAQRQQQEQLQPYLEVYAAAEQRIAHGKNHYAQERQRIFDAVHADADRALDKDAYLRTHLLPALNGVNNAEEAWIAGVGQDARNQVQAIREQQSVPAWAAHLVATRRLPQAAIGRILATTQDPRAMPAVADLLVEARNAIANEKRKATQANRSAQARTIAGNQVHPAATGRSPTGKLPEIQGSRDELLAILNMK
jgi:hypothetical protein